MIVLVTGGAGFIGRAVSRALLAAGHEVRVLDNFAASGREGLGDFEVIEGDVRDADVVREALAGCGAAVHLAALVSVPVSMAQPRETFENNVAGFENLLEAAREGRLQGPVLYASSAAVYGGVDKAPVREEDGAEGVGLSPYAASKRINEEQARSYAAAYGLRTVGLRFFNVYGAGQAADSPYSGVMAKLVDAARRGGVFKIFGDGEQTRDYVFVDDVAAAVVGLLGADVAGGSVFNVASGARVSLNELVHIVGSILETEVVVHREEERAGDIRHSGAEIAALQRVLKGWKPRGLSRGLKDWLAPR